MRTSFSTHNAFFASVIGRRTQEQVFSFFDKEDLAPLALIGSAAPFSRAFEQIKPEIVFETEKLPDNNPVFSLPTGIAGIQTVFIAVTNNFVANACAPLIKEAHRVLKPSGTCFVIIKNEKSLFSLSIEDMPEMSPALIKKELLDTGFKLKRRLGLLHFPFTGKAFKKADDFLFSIKMNGGVFSLFAAQKAPLATQTKQNYSSARITKASVFTSPRT